MKDIKKANLRDVLNLVKAKLSREPQVADGGARSSMLRTSSRLVTVAALGSMPLVSACASDETNEPTGNAGAAGATPSSAGVSVRGGTTVQAGTPSTGGSYAVTTAYAIGEEDATGGTSTVTTYYAIGEEDATGGKGSGGTVSAGAARPVAHPP